MRTHQLTLNFVTGNHVAVVVLDRPLDGAEVEAFRAGPARAGLALDPGGSPVALVMAVEAGPVHALVAEVDGLANAMPPERPDGRLGLDVILIGPDGAELATRRLDLPRSAMAAVYATAYDARTVAYRNGAHQAALDAIVRRVEGVPGGPIAACRFAWDDGQADPVEPEPAPEPTPAPEPMSESAKAWLAAAEPEPTPKELARQIEVLRARVDALEASTRL